MAEREKNNYNSIRRELERGHRSSTIWAQVPIEKYHKFVSAYPLSANLFNHLNIFPKSTDVESRKKPQHFDPSHQENPPIPYERYSITHNPSNITSSYSNHYAGLSATAPKYFHDYRPKTQDPSIHSKF